jgi:hypothetical protein
MINNQYCECNHFKSDDEARAFVLKIIIEKKGKNENNN